MKTKKILRLLAWSFTALFIIANTVAFFHAYKFTHFSDAASERTDPKKLSLGGKLSALFFGVNNPRPKNDKLPAHKFSVLTLQSNKKIECWEIRSDNARGTVAIFHGYGGQKSSMLDKAEEFLKMGFNVLLADFMGSGGSKGNQTTIGYDEAEQVKTCYAHLQKAGEKNIVLFGTSLGAAAILKSMHDHALQPSAIIIECPFGSLYQTTCARFDAMGVPSFPMAGLLVFWGGVQNGFWGFSHCPAEYAKSVTCPALLMYGEKDERVSREETNEIFKNLAGPKKLKLFANAGHENYLKNYKEEWVRDVRQFLGE